VLLSARLQDQYMELERQLKTTMEEKSNAHEKYKSLLEQTRADLHAKQVECEKLREQVSEGDYHKINISLKQSQEMTNDGQLVWVE